MNQLTPSQQSDLTLRVATGPDQGAIYKIVSTRVTLGRSKDNDIPLQDPRCSRHHAVIELKPEGIFIQDTSGHNRLEVDGLEVKEAVLQSGSQIRLGGTLLVFEVRSSQALATADSGLVAPTLSPSSRRPKSPLFYGIIGIIVLAFIFLMFSGNSRKKDEVELRTDTQIEEDIKAAQERRQALEKSIEKKGAHIEQEYNEIQALYTQGFRDYREGNYGRALSSFEAVLALRPDHEMARKYRDLARRRLDETIQITMLEAKRFMEQGKYRQAQNAYAQVMILLEDPKSKQYKEAQEYFKECELLLKGAF